jgi:hypothetical protein
MIKCILPWINFGTNTLGRPRVCGYSDFQAQWKKIFEDEGLSWPPPPESEVPEHLKESEFGKEWVQWRDKLENSDISQQWNGRYFRDIRKAFMSGEWPENCNRCKYVEESGGTSKRMDENHLWHDKYKGWLKSTLESGRVLYQPPHVDVRTGTVCNSKCIHCGPGASSKWQEDKSLIGKYTNLPDIEIDNTWIAQDNSFWDQLDISQIDRYNFLGGESFANKRHNQFIKKLSDSPYAKDVEVQYVTNGTLLNKAFLSILNKFKKVKLRLSVDAPGLAGEYFRYPLDWSDWISRIRVLSNFIADRENFDVAFQWTCSNISMFYLTATYDVLSVKFPNIRFLPENHVTDPIHLSAQNLPRAAKEKISHSVQKYPRVSGYDKFDFYINHMLAKDLWHEQGYYFLQYLNDIDKVRGLDWRYNFKEMVKYVE